MRVLIAHSQPNVVQMVERHLTKQGYIVESALDGGDALAKVQDDPPDILLCEYFLPALNGDELIKTLRADARFNCVKIISIFNDQAERNDSYNTWLEKIDQRHEALGADMSLPFPFNPASLLQFVNRLAEHIQAERGQEQDAMQS